MCSIAASMDLMRPIPLLLFTIFIAIASNIFSNVPLTVLVLAQLTPCAHQRLLVLYLGWIATIAGNLTLFGSVANLIFAQQAEVVCSQWKAQRARYIRRSRSRISRVSRLSKVSKVSVSKVSKGSRLSKVSKGVLPPSTTLGGGQVGAQGLGDQVGANVVVEEAPIKGPWGEEPEGMEALERYHLTFWRYLTIGPITTVLVTVAGILVIRVIMLFAD